MMVPAMLPPPTPFKLFLLAAGVFEMRPLLFMSAIFSGRVVRFLILGFLVVRFGPGIVSLMTAIMARHLIWVILGFVFLICLFVYEFKFRRPRAAQREGPTQAL